ncbi:hypothetical protein OMR07_19175 [Methylobacterium organophilum]|nr:hypothetical protein [Methylobacterium organophilum]
MNARSHTRHVVDQFGAQASAYVTSAVHAAGADLDRIGERVRARPGLRVLDLGCGGGPGEAAGLDDRHEGPHLPQVEIHKLRLSLRSDLFNCVMKCSAVS